ncbi:MAG: aquaporin Z [Paraburkholderia sp.]|nr:MAG: aquaporin Z [Paraburkholderia sp.]
MSMSKRFLAETFGTFWLVFCGCGSALIAASFPGAAHGLGIGFAGVALAFGLTVLTMAYAVGHISGCHLNPAVTIGLTVARRFPVRDVVPYIVAQLIGATLAAWLLLLIMKGNPAFDLASSSFATNGYAERSPGHYTLEAAFVCEAVMTGFFLFVILGATDKRAPAGFAPIAIGLCLTLIHLVSIPVTGTSVNPARSTGPALVAGGDALAQLWAFWAAPMLGAIVAGLLYPAIAGHADAGAPTQAVPAEAGFATSAK